MVLLCTPYVAGADCAWPLLEALAAAMAPLQAVEQQPATPWKPPPPGALKAGAAAPMPGHALAAPAGVALLAPEAPHMAHLVHNLHINHLMWRMAAGRE